MIYLEDDFYLNLLWIIPILLIIYFISRGRQSKSKLKLGDPILIDKLITGISVRTNFFKFLLLIIALILLIFSLTGPFLRGSKNSKKAFAQTSIVFVVDVSKSMLATDVTPNRLAQAKGFIQNILTDLHGEQVGMVVFAGKANAFVPLTSDYTFVRSAVKSISNDLIVKQGTSLNDALKISASFFNNKNKNVRVLCVISDGEAHKPDFGGLADSIMKSGVNIFSFGLGTKEGGSIIEQNRLGDQLVKKDKNGALIISHLHEENLLRIVGGKTNRYFRLSDKDIAALNFKKELEIIQNDTVSIVFTEREYFQLFLLISLFLLVADFFIGKL